MKKLLLVATNQSLNVYHRINGDWQELRRGLKGSHVTSLIARQGTILAGTTDGIQRSDDLGETWQEASRGLANRHVRWMAYHPDISDFELAGTEPAGIFVSKDGGANWRECLEVAELRDQYGWYLPYSPEAGCVRGFAHHGNHAFAAVEVGGVLTSQDGGESWRLAEGSRGDPHSAPQSCVHSDVHSIAVHPSSAALIYAPTGGGFYRSMDGGKSWKLRYPCYCRATWVDSSDPDHILLGPADGVDRNGRIEETQDGGQFWLPASKGLPTPWPHHMVERFTQVDDELLAVLSNGELFGSPLQSLEWRQILKEARQVKAVTIMAI